MSETKTYMVDGKIIDIPSKDTGIFLNKYPNAIEYKSFILGKDTIDIPFNDIDYFSNKYPEAKPLYGNMIEDDLKSDNPDRFTNAMSQLAKSFTMGFGNTSKSIGILAKKINLFGEYDGMATEELATYKFGQFIQDWAEKTFPTDERLQKEFLASTLPSAFGSMAFYMVGGLPARTLKLGAFAAGTASGVLGALDASAGGYDEAKAAGKSEDVAWRSYLENMGWGATEAIPIGRLFKRIDKLSDGILHGIIKKYTTRKLLTGAATEGLEELTQEFAQTIGQNWTAQRLYDFNRQLLDGAAEGGAAGFITGSIMAALGLKMREKKLKRMGLTDNDIKLLDKALELQEEYQKKNVTALLNPIEVQDYLNSQNPTQEDVDRANAAAEQEIIKSESIEYQNWMEKEGIDQSNVDAINMDEQFANIIDPFSEIAKGINAQQSINELDLVGADGLNDAQEIIDDSKYENIKDGLDQISNDLQNLSQGLTSEDINKIEGERLREATESLRTQSEKEFSDLSGQVETQPTEQQTVEEFTLPQEVLDNKTEGAEEYGKSISKDKDKVKQLKDAFDKRRAKVSEMRSSNASPQERSNYVFETQFYREAYQAAIGEYVDSKTGEVVFPGQYEIDQNKARFKGKAKEEIAEILASESNTEEEFIKKLKDNGLIDNDLPERFHKQINNKNKIASAEYIIAQAIRIMGDETKARFVEEIKSNPDAIGRYFNGMAEYILGRATVETAHHEPIHWWLNHVLSQNDYDFLYDHFKNENDDPVMVEERMVDAAVEYDINKQNKGFVGRIGDIFKNFWSKIRRLFGKKLSKEDTIASIFGRIGNELDSHRSENIAKHIIGDKSKQQKDIPTIATGALTEVTEERNLSNVNLDDVVIVDGNIDGLLSGLIWSDEELKYFNESKAITLDDIELENLEYLSLISDKYKRRYEKKKRQYSPRKQPSGYEIDYYLTQLSRNGKQAVVEFENPTKTPLTTRYSKFLRNDYQQEFVSLSQPFKYKMASEIENKVLSEFYNNLIEVLKDWAKRNNKPFPKKINKNVLADKIDEFVTNIYPINYTGAWETKGAPPYNIFNNVKRGVMVSGNEILLSDDFLYKKLDHKYDTNDQSGIAGIGWYIASYVGENQAMDMFIYEYQSDMLPEIAGKHPENKDMSEEELLKWQLSNYANMTLSNEENLRQSEIDKFPHYFANNIVKNRIRSVQRFNGDNLGIFPNEKTDLKPLDKENLRNYIKFAYDSLKTEREQIRKSLASSMVVLRYLNTNKRYFAVLNKYKDKGGIGLNDFVKTLNEYERNLLHGFTDEQIKMYVMDSLYGEGVYYKTQKEIFEKRVNGLTKKLKNKGKELHKIEFKEKLLSDYNNYLMIFDYYQSQIDRMYDYFYNYMSNIINKEPKRKDADVSETHYEKTRDLYKVWWDKALIHSLYFAKSQGRNKVYLPTAHAMEEIEQSVDTGALYSTPYDAHNPNFNNTSPYWNALKKIKNIKIKPEQPEWSKNVLLSVDISELEITPIERFHVPKMSFDDVKKIWLEKQESINKYNWEESATEKPTVEDKGIPTKIISGGQTGADEAGLIAAKELGIETGEVVYPGQYSIDSKSAKKPVEKTSEGKATTPQNKGTINVYWGEAESETSTKLLSNLAPRKFTWEGREYGSVEHAYQSNKSGTFDQTTYEAYNKIGGYGKKIRGKGTVAEMKAADSLGLMKQLVVESFVQNPNSEATAKLLQYENFTHNNNELIDKAFLEGLKLAQKELNTTGTKQKEQSKKSDNVAEIKYGKNVTNSAIAEQNFEENKPISNEKDTRQNDPDDSKYPDSIQGEPVFGSNNIVNKLLKDNKIEKENAFNVSREISDLARKSPNANTFEMELEKEYGATIESDKIAQVYRRERSLEGMQVLDVDFMGEEISISDSNFIDHNGKDLSNRYLMNSVLRPYMKDIAIINMYLTDSEGNRYDSANTRSITHADLVSLQTNLFKKGYTLLPLSDSDTIVAIKLNNDYAKKNESTEEHVNRLRQEALKRYPELEKMVNVMKIPELMQDLSRDDFLKKTLSFWYNGKKKANDVAKRFKLFLPKGVELKYRRKLKMQLVQDIELKNIKKSDGSPFVVTDGTTIGNPNTYPDFLEYNKLGEVTQHKTIITQSDGDSVIAVKHMTHVVSKEMWNKLSKQLGFDPNVDLIAFDSAAKLAENKDGRIGYDKIIELNPESIRHIFSGSEHLIATLSRQIFNFTGTDENVNKHIIDEVIQPIFNKVLSKFESLETNPNLLKSELENLIGEIEEGLSDYRRYINLDAIYYKTIRKNIRNLLKNKYIIDAYIKLKQAGGVGYLMPDFDLEVKRGEVQLPFSQSKKILSIAKKNGFNGTTLSELNQWLSENELKVLTYRSPIPKPDNIQLLRVQKILPKAFGQATVMNTQDVILNKEGDMDGDEIHFHYLNNESDINYIGKQIENSQRNVGEVSLGTGDAGPAFSGKSMIDVGFMAGLGKKAVGEVAKASTVRQILESNNVRIGAFPFINKEGEKDVVYKIITPQNEANAVKIYGLIKDWKEFDRKLAYTLQGSVDNLKMFALSPAKYWAVNSDGFIGYNLRDLYLQMFDGLPKQGIEALTDIRNALNIFAKDYDNNLTLSQEKMNQIAWQYRRIVETSEGALGKSAIEKMIIDIAELGYLPSYDVDGRIVDGAKENFINSIHDNAHINAANIINSEVINKTPSGNIDQQTKKNIEEAIKKLYIAYNKLAKKENVSSADFQKLFDNYLLKFKDKLHQHERNYADYLTFKGYSISLDKKTGNYYISSNINPRFILNVMDDANIKLFSQIFNKEYNRLLEKGKNELKFVGLWKTVQPETVLGMGGSFGGNSSLKMDYDLAIVRFFKDFNLGAKYSKEDSVPFKQALKLVDRINRELYELGRLPFSDVVDIKVLYKEVLENRGKTLSDELTAADGYAILVELKRMRHNLKTGKVNSIKKYFFFTHDIFIRNPYTAAAVKKLNKISNEKDADTANFLGRISNIEENDRIRELLNIVPKGDITTVSRMHAAEDILNRMGDIKKNVLLEETDKVNKEKQKIQEILNNDSLLKRQVDLLLDFVRALDGQFGKTEKENRNYILNKYGTNATKAFDISRKLLDDIIEYDIVTFDQEIGPADKEYYDVEIDGIKYQRKSKQYAWIKKLKEQLRQSGWKERQIIGFINNIKIFRPERRDNYYPHYYFGLGVNEDASLDFLNNFDSMSEEDILLFSKGIGAWKKRDAEYQNTANMADLNLFRVLSRRANTSVNARYTNRFRQTFEFMTSKINDGLKKQSEKGNYDGMLQLIELRAIAENMYKDVTNIPTFSWAKSFMNILKGLYVSNLLLISTKGNLRNLTQGIFPNFIEFAGSSYNRGRNFLKSGGIVKFEDGSEHDVFDSLGISRADIFAKVEGGQEWDIYKSYRDIIELQKATTEFKKAKIIAKQYMISIENSMNRFVKVAGENNVFTLTYGLGKKLIGLGTRKLTNKYIIPEINPKSASFSGIEKNNRRLTASMAFIQKWEELRSMQDNQRRGMTKEQLIDLDKRTYDTAIKHAINMIDKIQFNYNMWNRPSVIRGPIKSTIFQFKSFTLGMLKLHWNWIFDVAINPYKEWKKVLWFSMISMIVGSATKLFNKDFWRFFEIPEYEYLSNFYNLFFGNSKERRWAFYGNRLTPITGPIGGMAFEALIGSNIADEIGIYDSNHKRREIAIQRLVDSHVPLIKEYGQIYNEAQKIIKEKQTFAEGTANYIGLYQTYEKKGIAKPSPLRKDNNRYLPEDVYKILRKFVNKYTR